MTTIRQVLCASDLSPASGPAWEHARLLAGLTRAELVLLHVVPPVITPSEGYFPPDLYHQLVESGSREAQAELDRIVGGGSTVKVTVQIEQGSPASRIVAIAEERSADLLVVGTQGRSGLNRIVVGSVADRVIRSAPCPTVTVPARLEGSPRPRTISRICYATDFSTPARAAWRYVVLLAEATGAEVDLVHVTLQAVPDRDMSADTLETMGRAFREQGEAQAAEFLRESPLAGNRVHVVIGTGVPEEFIIHTAQSRAANLIVMGTHGRSGVLRWMLGSVAYHLIREAPCPVLTVGPQGQTADSRRVT